MTFKITGAIFKNTAEKLKQRFGDRFDANKKYLPLPVLKVYRFFVEFYLTILE